RRSAAESRSDTQHSLVLGEAAAAAGRRTRHASISLGLPLCASAWRTGRLSDCRRLSKHRAGADLALGDAGEFYGRINGEWEEIFPAIDYSDGSARQGFNRRVGGTIQIVQRTLRRVVDTLGDVGEREFDPQTITGPASSCARGRREDATRCIKRETSGVCRDGSWRPDRKSTRLNSSHVAISYAVFCLKKKKQIKSIQS